ncbi:prolyl aminopeptidase [Mycoplasma phocoenae]|uniref:Proline iminopeptidase n=1 Tax=Mycoplasma phocoenae TaxID=754517 RepID=A0A858U7I2_9MOLU|nr:prolyl aminopeptidase [Mycoplasma phocoenae]QJG66738.1 prolyl aminopeptidase [Mycoplasma phocoenae]
MYIHNNVKSYFIQRDIHSIHYTVSGNDDGLPVVVIHGGPGGGMSMDSLKFFDPDFYKVIMIDQRGCGKSTPSASIVNNTTQDLIEDINAIRQALSINTWIVFGGSWGTTLALTYAQKYPENVKKLVLRGVFLGRQADLEWLYGPNGASNFFYDEYQNFTKYANTQNVDELIKFYHKQINSNDSVISQKSAQMWADWEMSIVTLIPTKSPIENIQDIINFSQMETHYFLNNCFLKENQIMNNIDKIKHIPMIIVHGRYDIDCRPSAAFLLADSVEKAQLAIIEASGHSQREENIAKELYLIMEEEKDKSAAFHYHYTNWNI